MILCTCSLLAPNTGFHHFVVASVLIVVCGSQPLFFYASLLAVFGIEIMVDWLGRSFHKVSRVEYALLWFTFAAITQGRNTSSCHEHEFLATHHHRSQT